MEEDNNNDQVERFRSILSGDEDEPAPQPAPASQPQKPLEQSRPQPQTTQSVLSQLPKNQTSTPPATQPEQKAVFSAPKSTPPKATPQGDKKQLPPQLPKQKMPSPPVQSPGSPPTTISPAQPPEPQPPVTTTTQTPLPMSRGEKLLRALWTITSVISMTVNVVVVIIVLLAVNLLRDFKLPTELPEGIDIMVLNNLLSGLYDNFELMDDANISATIPVNDQIPVQFDLELKQPTTVVLSEAVTIRGAYVVINTPVIDINAPAVVTLPQGTNLPILLDLVVPVDKQVPVNLNVQVDIPLEKTELHQPFVGLQDVVRPLYCLVEPGAMSSLTNEPVCETK